MKPKINLTYILKITNIIASTNVVIEWTQNNNNNKYINKIW